MREAAGVRRSCLSVLLALVVALAGCAAAPPGPRQDEALAAFKRGVRAYELKDYAAARALLDHAAAFEVSLGRSRDRTLDVLRGRIDNAFAQARTRLRGAQRYCILGNYPAASDELGQIEATGVNYGPDFDRECEDYAALLEVAGAGDEADPGQVEQLLSRVSSRLQAGDAEGAGRLLTAVQYTPACRASHQLSTSAYRLQAELSLAQAEITQAADEPPGREAADRDVKQAESLLRSAENKLIAGEFAPAQGLLDGLMASPLYGSNAQIAAAADGLAARLAQARAEAPAGPEKVDPIRRDALRLLAIGADSLQAGDLEGAERILDQVVTSSAYSTYEDVSRQARRLSRGVRRTRAELAEDERHARFFLKDAGEKMAAGDVMGAGSSLKRAESARLYQSDPDFQRHVTAVREQVERAALAQLLERVKVEEILRQGFDLLLAGDLDGAERALSVVRQTTFYTDDEALRQEAERLAAGLAKLQQMRQEALGQLDEVEKLCAAEDFPAAEKALQQVADSEASAKLPEVRERAAALRDGIASARAASEGRAQAAQEARTALEAGLKAWAAGDSYEARGQLESAAALGADLGPADNRRLQEGRQAVAQAREQWQRDFDEASKLLAEGEFGQATEAFEALDAQAMRMGGGLDEALVQRLARAEFMAENYPPKSWWEEKARHEAAELERLREERLTSATAELAQARESLQAGRLDSATDHLKRAREMLSVPELEGDEKAIALLAEADQIAALVQQKMADTKNLAEKQKQLDSMFEGIEALLVEDPAAAERELEAALDLAARLGIELSEGQAATAERVREEAERIPGPVRQGRIALRRNLLRQSRHYEEAGEHTQALAVLEMALAGEGVTEAERADISDRTSAARGKLARQQELLKTVEEKTDAAQAAVQAGEWDAALQACHEAYDVAGGISMATADRLPLLEACEEAAAGAVPHAVAARRERMFSGAAQQQKVAAALVRARKAAVLLQMGSPDLAAPLLRDAVEDQLLDADTRAWAAEQLKGVSDAIRKLKEAESLADMGAVSRAQQLENAFQEALASGESDRAAGLIEQLGAAGRELRRSRAARALGRGNYEALEGLILREDTSPDFAAMREQAARWEQGERLVGEALKAIGYADAISATSALAALGAIELPGRPFDSRVEVLTAQRDTVQGMKADVVAFAREQAGFLEALRRSRDSARARLEGWEQYEAALSLCSAQKWDQAGETLSALRESGVGLRSFERANAGELLRVAARAVPAAAGAEGLLKEAEARVAARDFMGAAAALEAARQAPDFAQVADGQARAGRVRAAIDGAEGEAMDLLQRARNAYKESKLDVVGELVKELRARYNRTRTYEENYQ